MQGNGQYNGTGYKKGDKKELAYTFIRDAIMQNRFEPNTPLSEQELAAMLDDMSRTPIRDALIRLEHEGLAERIPGKGLFVAQASIADLVEITEIRLPLECTAVRLFVERADAGMREHMHEITEEHRRLHLEGDDLGAVTWDNEFHFHIAKCSMNTRLYSTVRKLIEESSRGAFMTRHDAERIEKSIKQHERVAAAIDKNDAELAAAAMSEHLLDWNRYVNEMHFKNYFLFNH